MTDKKRKVCAKCGEAKNIISRGLCYKCRKEETDAGTIDQNYPPKRQLFKKKETADKDVETAAAAVAVADDTDSHPVPAPEENTSRETGTDDSPEQITISFYERDHDLLSTLIERARYNRRTVQDEILFRLEHGLSENSLPCLPDDRTRRYEDLDSVIGRLVFGGSQ